MKEFANAFFVAPPEAKCNFVAPEGTCRVPGTMPGEDGEVDLRTASSSLDIALPIHFQENATRR